MNTFHSMEKSNGSIKTLQILNILGFILMVFINFLANWLPLNGKTTGELSDQYPNLFTPSGATFSIWGIIYFLLFLYTIYQSSTLFSAKPSYVNTVVRQTGIWYLVSSILNSLWIIAWHYELLPVSVAIMWLLLLSLILINFGIANVNGFLPTKDRVIAKAPFGIYLGWISVATIANMTVWLTGIQWRSGFEPDTWAFLMILIGAMITTYAAFRLKNGFLTLAVVWAFTGIVLKRLNQEPVYYSIVFIAGVSSIVLLIVSLLLISRERNEKKVVEKQPTPLYD